jgi:hypothetical protein
VQRTGLQHAGDPSSFARKRGCLSSQRRSDELQRGANAQPGGIAFGFGTMPGMAVNRRRGPSIGGSAPVSPSV